VFARAQSEKLFAEALKYIPGGGTIRPSARVSPRARRRPAVLRQSGQRRRASGTWTATRVGFDYVCHLGAGHLSDTRIPEIISAIKAAADHGASFGIPNPFEVTMAKLILFARARRAKGAHVQFRHRGVHVGDSPRARIHPGAIKSSSSTAAITVMWIRCW